MKYLFIILNCILVSACSQNPDFQKLIFESQMKTQREALISKFGDNKFTQSFHEYIMKNTSFKVIEVSKDMTEIKIEKTGPHPEAITRILLKVNKSNFNNDISYFIDLVNKERKKENKKAVESYPPFPHPGTCKIKKENRSFIIEQCKYKNLKMDKNGNIIIFD